MRRNVVCASNGEEKIGSLKKKRGHLFSSILSVLFPERNRQVLRERERRRRKMGKIRLEKCLVEADKEESWEQGKRKELKEERG